MEYKNIYYDRLIEEFKQIFLKKCEEKYKEIIYQEFLKSLKPYQSDLSYLIDPKEE
mgnify:CR=1 FL=1